MAFRILRYSCFFSLISLFYFPSLQDKPKHFIMKRFQNIKGKFQQEREAQMRNSMNEDSEGYYEVQDQYEEEDR
jgi:hypothetical protein